MSRIINAAIQIIPLAGKETAYPVIDRAIEIIQQSGLNHEVSAFETSVDGTWGDINALINTIKKQLDTEPVNDVLINVKYQLRKDADVAMNEKVEKFRNQD
jgi:uncharacterized protein YqgV (UPF0045/DUF77 family)